MKVSVIMPVERTGGDAERAIASVLDQDAPFPYELVLVSAAPLQIGDETRVRNVVEPNRNPATRRNRAVSAARGEILAFIDDDARARRDWLRTAVEWLDRHANVLALGGPDPAPDDSTPAELLSDTLLATPLIGSGIACHENRKGIFEIANAHDVALVNLFVRKSAFTGFDETIGYIGEDTRLVEELLARGRVVYHQDVVVYHRRRAFPGAYLRQRWRYRVKTGELFVRGSKSHRSPKVTSFLVAGAIGIALAPVAIVPYFLATLVLGASVTRLPRRQWLMIPPAFALHHATYWLGIVWGMVRALAGRHNRA